MIVVT